MHQKDLPYIKYEDGREPGITLYWEDEVTSSSRPVVLIFHGGGFTIGSRHSVNPLIIQNLASSGIVVASVDYSLCPQVSLYEGPLKDAKAAWRWCKEELSSVMSKEDVHINGSRIATMGFSAGATLALCLGAEKDQPTAILDFYGAKYFDDQFWYAPLPALSQLPDLEDDFLNGVFQGDIPTFTGLSLERVSQGQANKPKKGMPKPDLTVPRNAWLFSSLKHGTHLKSIVKDNNYGRVDPATGFSASFPPVMFIHGSADSMVPNRLSQRAHSALDALGVNSTLLIVADAQHGFEIGMEAEDQGFVHVLEGLDFLKEHLRKEE